MQAIVTPDIAHRKAARFMPPPVRPAASAAPRLRDRMRDQIRLEGKSPRTFDVYWHWCAGFIRFHGLRHPSELGAAEVEAYLNHLVNVRRLSKSSHGQALHGLLYLYRRVLGVDLPWLQDLRAPKPSIHAGRDGAIPRFTAAPRPRSAPRSRPRSPPSCRLGSRPCPG